MWSSFLEILTPTVAPTPPQAFIRRWTLFFLFLYIFIWIISIRFIHCFSHSYTHHKNKQNRTKQTNILKLPFAEAKRASNHTLLFPSPQSKHFFKIHANLFYFLWFHCSQLDWIQIQFLWSQNNNNNNTKRKKGDKSISNNHAWEWSCWDFIWDLQQMGEKDTIDPITLCSTFIQWTRRYNNWGCSHYCAAINKAHLSRFPVHSVYTENSDIIIRVSF